MSSPADPLHTAFGEQLYRAAERLIADGCVLDTRVLQAGTVVTGVVKAEPQGRHRIYIRYPHGQDSTVLEGECSCGTRSPCLHIAAVSIAAKRNAPAHKPVVV